MKQFSAACSFVLAAAAAAYGGVISTTGENAGTQLDIIGVTGSSTFGSDMAGLSVSVTFGTSGIQTCTWAALTTTSGGCSVAGLFNITLDGDTFSDSSPWVITNLSTSDTISLLVLNGAPARLSNTGTVFDRTFGGIVGTFGSALGKDANGSTSDASNGSALYQDVVAIQPNLPVGDIFTTLQMSFDGNGLGSGATGTFVADTDSIGVGAGIPEPGTTAFLGVGIAVMMLRRWYISR